MQVSVMVVDNKWVTTQCIADTLFLCSRWASCWQIRQNPVAAEFLTWFLDLVDISKMWTIYS